MARGGRQAARRRLRSALSAVVHAARPAAGGDHFERDGLPGLHLHRRQSAGGTALAGQHLLLWTHANHLGTASKLTKADTSVEAIHDGVTQAQNAAAEHSAKFPSHSAHP